MFVVTAVAQPGRDPQTAKDLKNARHPASAADRHQLPDPAQDLPQWGRALTTQRVADLFKTRQGLPGHLRQIQQEVNRALPVVSRNGRTSPQGKEVFGFIAQGMLKAAEAASFDFGEQTLTFSPDMAALKFSRVNGRVVVRSTPSRGR
jgi:hypothetical protein